MSTERESWYRCHTCNKPATIEDQLVEAAVKNNLRARWTIHERCQDDLLNTLIPGVELVIQGKNY